MSHRRVIGGSVRGGSVRDGVMIARLIVVPGAHGQERPCRDRPFVVGRLAQPAGSESISWVGLLDRGSGCWTGGRAVGPGVGLFDGHWPACTPWPVLGPGQDPGAARRRVGVAWFLPGDRVRDLSLGPLGRALGPGFDPAPAAGEPRPRRPGLRAPGVRPRPPAPGRPARGPPPAPASGPHGIRRRPASADQPAVRPRPPAPGVRPRVPGLRSPASGPRPPAPGVRPAAPLPAPASGPWRPASGVRRPASADQPPPSAARPPASAARSPGRPRLRRPASGVWGRPPAPRPDRAARATGFFDPGAGAGAGARTRVESRCEHPGPRSDAETGPHTQDQLAKWFAEKLLDSVWSGSTGHVRLRLLLLRLQGASSSRARRSSGTRTRRSSGRTPASTS